MHVFLIDWFVRSCVRNDRISGCGTLKWAGSKNYGGWVFGDAHTRVWVVGGSLVVNTLPVTARSFHYERKS